MAFNYIGFRSYFTGEDWETTLTEGNERVADETRYEMPIFVCSCDMNAALSYLDFGK